jgi:hypothetical protein
MSEMSVAEDVMRVPEARYSYYRRCQLFRKSGEQCKAPAENGSQICYAHAGQLATAVRRARERRVDRLEIHEEVLHLKLRFALATHLGNRLLQHRTEDTEEHREKKL